MVWPPVLCDPSRHSVHSFKKWCGHWVLFNYGEKDERIRSPLPTNHPNFQIIFFGWNISFFGGLCNCKNAVLSPPTLVLSKPNSTCLLGMWVTTPKALVNHWWPISKGPSKVVPDCFPHIPIKRHQQVLSFTKWGIHRFVFPQRFWRVTLGPYMTLPFFIHVSWFRGNCPPGGDPLRCAMGRSRGASWDHQAGTPGDFFSEISEISIDIICWHNSVLNRYFFYWKPQNYGWFSLMFLSGGVGIDQSTASRFTVCNPDMRKQPKGVDTWDCQFGYDSPVGLVEGASSSTLVRTSQRSHLEEASRWRTKVKFWQDQYHKAFILAELGMVDGFGSTLLSRGPSMLGGNILWQILRFLQDNDLSLCIRSHQVGLSHGGDRWVLPLVFCNCQLLASHRDEMPNFSRCLQTCLTFTYFSYDSLPLSAPIISKGKIAQVWRIPWVSLLVTGGVGERAVQVPKTMDGYELLHNGSLDHWTRAAAANCWFSEVVFRAAW